MHRCDSWQLEALQAECGGEHGSLGANQFFRSTCELLEVRSQLLVLNEPGVTQKMMAAGVSAVDGLADLASPIGEVCSVAAKSDSGLRKHLWRSWIEPRFPRCRFSWCKNLHPFSAALCLFLLQVVAGTVATLAAAAVRSTSLYPVKRQVQGYS